MNAGRLSEWLNLQTLSRHHECAKRSAHFSWGQRIGLITVRACRHVNNVVDQP
jgi:hypothetical protein